MKEHQISYKILLHGINRIKTPLKLPVLT